jgi:hypothetical protein
MVSNKFMRTCMRGKRRGSRNLHARGPRDGFFYLSLSLLPWTISLHGKNSRRGGERRGHGHGLFGHGDPIGQGAGRSRALGWPVPDRGAMPCAGRAAHCSRGQTAMGGACVLAEGSEAGARCAAAAG